ncbi:hypothetical protein [Neobacillus cucumis]|uniref:hypothetical protein n=1 Tax=Neobacillus cucumis TaxID=1740721 RepID=UPI002E1B24ED|nr:hypothetical protein [Neobacillus cucumis]
MFEKTVFIFCFTKLGNSLYPNGTKTVTADWLNNVDELALTVWYLDDGSLNKRYGTITISTNCFTFQEHMVMQEWFKSRWNIDVIIEPSKSKHSSKEQYRLRINKSQAGHFLEIIKQYVPDCMKYKIG